MVSATYFLSFPGLVLGLLPNQFLSWTFHCPLPLSNLIIFLDFFQARLHPFCGHLTLTLKPESFAVSGFYCTCAYLLPVLPWSLLCMCLAKDFPLPLPWVMPECLLGRSGKLIFQGLSPIWQRMWFFCVVSEAVTSRLSKVQHSPLLTSSCLC